MNQEFEFPKIQISREGRIQEFLERGGIPPSEIHANPSHLDEQIRRRIESLLTDLFMKTRPNAVLLVGTTGVGKTYAMAAFAKLVFGKRYGSHTPEFIESSKLPLLWRSVPDLVAEWKSMALRAADQERFLQRFLHVDYLFLDDLGAEMKERGGREADKGLAFVERVIRHRYDHFKPTSCTTNCNAEALLLRYGAPVFSRLQHMSMWIEFPKGSRDRRLQPRNPIQ